jgi:carbamate kinase
VDAVIDKDHASCRIALDLGFETLAFVTGVDAVQVDFGTPAARPLRRVGVSELTDLAADGQFPPGSMGPKIDAALAFLAGGGREVVITDPAYFQAAMDGRAGTHVIPDAAGD